MTSNPSPENELPDDVHRWPLDPETLLGVTPESTRRDLKRAYTRLIKRFKPEHAPEQFRRLREAFEQLDQELAWREQIRLIDVQRQTAENDVDETQSDLAINSDPMPPPETLPRVRNAESRDAVDSPAAEFKECTDGLGGPLSNSKPAFREKSPDQWWQVALDGGDLNDVYSGLLKHTRERHATDIEFARLYWLLTLRSDLESDRDPCSWLVEGLKQSGDERNRLYQMLDTEVRRRGGQVPLVLADELIDGRHPVHCLVDLAETRWYAARKLNRFDVISSDYERLQRRFIDEPVHWLRFMATALRAVLLTHADATIRMLREELEQQPATASQNWIWDGLEFDLKLHDAWKQGPPEALRFGVEFPAFVRTMMKLFECTWISSPTENRFEVLEFCESLAANADRKLNELAHMERTVRPLIRRLLELIEEQLSESNIELEVEMTPALDQELQRFVHRQFFVSDQAGFDINVMRFCVQEAVTPQDIAATLHRMKVAIPDSYFEVADRLVNNLSLNCMVKAHRLLW